MDIIENKIKAKNDSFAEALGMRYDRVNRVICGRKDGFDVILYEAEAWRGINNPFSFSAHVSAARPTATGEMFTASEMQELENGLKKLNDLPFVGYCQQDGCNLVVPDIVSAGWMGAENEAKKLDFLCAFLKDKGCRSCCSRCGQEASEISPFRLGGSYQHLCLACEADIRSRFAVQKQQRKENVLLGMVGVLPGALLGLAAIVLALQAEFFLELVLLGAVMAVCILKGYELLGGRLTKKAAVIGSVVTLPVVYVADRLEWAVQIYDDRRFRLSFDQCFERIPLLISNNVISLGEYITRLTGLYLLLFLGAVLGAVWLFKREKGRGQRKGFARLGEM